MRTSEECNAAPGYVFDNPTKTAADLCDQHLSRWHRLFTLIVTLDSEHEARHGKSAIIPDPLSVVSNINRYLGEILHQVKLTEMFAPLRTGPGSRQTLLPSRSPTYFTQSAPSP